jgi:hypothetical protein
VPQSARNVLFLAGLALAVVGLAYLLASRAREPRDALTMAPSHTVGVAELDVPGLRTSALWAELVGDGDAGMARVRQACGFDPLDAVRTLHVFLLGESEDREDPSEASLDEVAFVARGALDHEALVRCIGAVVAEDGGGVHPTVIEGVDALASDHGASVAAFYGRDGLVAGADVVVAELLRIQQGASPPMARDEGLTRLWGRTASRRHVRLVVRLPRNWQRFVERVATVGALDALSSARAVALGATLDEGIALTAAVELGDRDAAVDAQRVLDTRARETIADPELGVSAVSVPLRRLALEASGRDLVARVTLDRAELEAVVLVLRRALASRARDDAPRALPDPARDETLAPTPAVP